MYTNLAKPITNCCYYRISQAFELLKLVSHKFCKKNLDVKFHTACELPRNLFYNKFTMNFLANNAT